MALVFIPPQLRDLTHGDIEVQVSARNVRQVIAALDRLYPGMSERLQQGDQVAPGLAFSIDGVMSPRGLLAAVSRSSEVHIVPALGGG
jgi:hypothetical protein